MATEAERLPNLSKVTRDKRGKVTREGRKNMPSSKALSFLLLSVDNLLLNPDTAGSLSLRCSPPPPLSVCPVNDSPSD
ncbi:rCG37413, partial [Rattus norvegicus]